jgi:hypothetical protein
LLLREPLYSRGGNRRGNKLGPYKRVFASQLDRFRMLSEAVPAGSGAP